MSKLEAASATRRLGVKCDVCWVIWHVLQDRMTLVTGQLRLKTQVKYFTDWYTGRGKKLKLQFGGLRTYGCELMARLWSRVLAEEETEEWQGI